MSDNKWGSNSKKDFQKGFTESKDSSWENLKNAAKAIGNAVTGGSSDAAASEYDDSYNKNKQRGNGQRYDD